MSFSTQSHIPIKSIANDVVLLKDGGAALILETSAVNFDLLSEGEQIAIIGSFAALLNSLNFAIQIVIRSKKLDISKYLLSLESAEKQQHNQLLKQMITSYRSFVSTLIKENEVIDKQFYVVIPISYLELGIVGNAEKDIQKLNNVVIPRRDHVIKQLARSGLKAKQLQTEQLIKLFYDIYNESDIYTPFVAQPVVQPPVQPATPQVQPAPVNQIPVNPPPQPVSYPPSNNQGQPGILTPQQIMYAPPPLQTKAMQQASVTPNPTPVNDPRRVSQHVPFVVEELPDDYGAIV